MNGYGGSVRSAGRALLDGRSARDRTKMKLRTRHVNFVSTIHWRLRLLCQITISVWHARACETSESATCQQGAAAINITAHARCRG